jgi:membrane-bound ClpP family serine protease
MIRSARGKNRSVGFAVFERTNKIETLQAKLRELTPATDAQRQLFATAQQIISDLRQSRWLLIEQMQHVIPIPFLVVLLFWLTMLHISFGLLAPRNATVVTVLLISALSVSGALFIILDMTHPLQGMIKVSSAPMRNALEHLGQ